MLENSTSAVAGVKRSTRYSFSRGTYQRHALVHIWPIRLVEDLALVRIEHVVGQVVLHHDHDVIIVKAATLQNLVCLRRRDQMPC